MKRLRDKPVQSFAGSDTFLRIAQAEKEGLIEVRIDVGPLHSHVLALPTSLFLRYSLPVNPRGLIMEIQAHVWPSMRQMCESFVRLLKRLCPADQCSGAGGHHPEHDQAVPVSAADQDSQGLERHQVQHSTYSLGHTKHAV